MDLFESDTYDMNLACACVSALRGLNSPSQSHHNQIVLPMNDFKKTYDARARRLLINFWLYNVGVLALITLNCFPYQ